MAACPPLAKGAEVTKDLPLFVPERYVEKLEAFRRKMRLGGLT
jgi:hypothetical protein